MSEISPELIRQVTDFVNRGHAVHEERYFLTSLRRVACSCGWISREYCDDDGFDRARLKHVDDVVLAQVEKARKLATVTPPREHAKEGE